MDQQRQFYSSSNKGAEFTWSNGRESRYHIELRLDRSIVNADWISFWSGTSCNILVRCNSDHYPLSLTMNKGISARPSTFKFFKMWTEHDECSRLVKEVWSRSVIGCPMTVIAQKLKWLKAELKV